jgi:hypothetical protein
MRFSFSGCGTIVHESAGEGTTDFTDDKQIARKKTGWVLFHGNDFFFPPCNPVLIGAIRGLRGAMRVQFNDYRRQPGAAA